MEVRRDVLQWVERIVGPSARVVATDLLRAKPTQPTWRLLLDDKGTHVWVVMKISPLDWEGGVRIEAHALDLIHTLGIPAPRLLGVDVIGEPAVVVLLESHLPGSNSGVTARPVERMHALGVAAAALHSTRLPVDHGLAHIDRPACHDNFIADRQAGRAPTTPLLQAAEQLWEQCEAPMTDDVLVHGDFHRANVLWHGDQVSAYIDWDGTGVGHPGIDLGWSRLEAALAYSAPAADAIVHGWTDVTGSPPDRLAYWDLTAALQNDADIGDRRAGRDQFLNGALHRLTAP